MTQKIRKFECEMKNGVRSHSTQVFFYILIQIFRLQLLNATKSKKGLSKGTSPNVVVITSPLTELEQPS